jgi:hypothetical protein
MRASRWSVACTLVLSALFGGLCEASPRFQVNYPDLKQGVEAYEKNCVLMLRMLNSVQGTFRGGDPGKGYARTLKELGLAEPGF